MAALFWNCKGINNGTTVQALRSLIRDHRPLIVFLSETKNDNVDVHVRAKDTYFIDVVVNGQNPNVASWHLTGFYGHPTHTERHRSWATLRTLSDADSLPWLILGDCNEIVSSLEKVGGRSLSERQMQDFRDALDYYGLYDMGFTSPMFTWRDCTTKIRWIEQLQLERGWICSAIQEFLISRLVRVITSLCC
ncbi:hypothetical protein M0R45_006609 [Rubus argutus]|uniref:Endonuclease/exonuclease/phosphatase domain-containing protein n=1 Tax=Rubus argutus TaxID=59490 RepID=A0AAW1YQZ5_RUBAR